VIVDRPSPGPEPDWERLFEEDERMAVKKESLRCQLGKHADGKADSCPGTYNTPRGPSQGEHKCECSCHEGIRVI
jgi:hypothetical protein